MLMLVLPGLVFVVKVAIAFRKASATLANLPR